MSKWIYCALLILGASNALYCAGIAAEFMQSAKWRSTTSGYAPSTNPALLGNVNYSRAFANATGSSNGAGYLWESAVILPYGLYHTFSVSSISEQGAQLQNVAFTGSDELVTEDIGQRNNTTALLLSYAYNVWRKLTIGATATVLYQTNFGDPNAGFTADAAAVYSFGPHPLLGVHSFGLNLKNTIPVSLGSSSENRIHPQIVASVTSEIPLVNLTSHLQYAISELTIDESLFDTEDISRKKELLWTLSAVLFKTIGLGLFAGSEFPGDPFAGAHLELATLPERNLWFAYALRGEIHHTTALSHGVTARLDFGKSREEQFARNQLRASSVLPNDLYNQAMSLYNEEKWFEAFLVFRKIESDFPSFFKMRNVRYYRIASMEHMKMYHTASEGYSKFIAHYSNTTLAQHALLGQVRVHYALKDYLRLKASFTHIQKTVTIDSLLHHAQYYYGQSLIKMNNLKDAATILEKIPPHHPHYASAQHSLGVIYFTKNNTYQGRLHLQNSAEAHVQTLASDRSWLFLGIEAYERRDFRKSYQYIRNIKPASLFFDNALLISGWAAYFSGNWSDCFSIGKELFSPHYLPILQVEGLFLQTIAQVGRGNKKEALKLAFQTQQLLKNSKMPDHLDRIQKMQIIDETISQNDYFAQQLLQKTSSGLPQQHYVAELKQQGIAYQENLFQLQYEIDTYDRQLQFWRSETEINQNLDYIIAFLQKQITQRDQLDAKKQASEEIRSYDAEIQKIQQQLEDIE